MSTKRISPKIKEILRNGGIGILPTDTIYGIVGSALNKEVVEKVYKLRKRSPKKPMVILVGSTAQLKIFGVRVDKKTGATLQKLWPGKVSLVLGFKDQGSRIKFKYLHRGTHTLAFRLPQPYWLKRLLVGTGPLVAPSANLEGKPPAQTAKEARRYFGGGVDFYINGGRLRSKPSTLVKVMKGEIIVLRKGAVRLAA